MKKCIMLACKNIEKELTAAVKECNSDIPIFFIPEEMHLSPDNLRVYLQSAIDSIINVDYILLPMGLCGNGTVGLVSQSASIVLPKCGDCIDLMLSGDNIIADRPKYTYFLTDGWLGKKSSIDAEFTHTVEKYGETRAKKIIGMIYKNYKYFSFIDTGVYCIKTAEERIKPMAEMADMEINALEGKFGVLKKMVGLHFDDNFIIVPPGQRVSEAAFKTCAGNLT